MVALGWASVVTSDGYAVEMRVTAAELGLDDWPLAAGDRDDPRVAARGAPLGTHAQVWEETLATAVTGCASVVCREQT
jgi:hypothetical protein